MNPEIKKLWVEALRSGEYTQAKGALCRTGDVADDQTVGYCCLGVLTDLAVKAGVVEWAPDPVAPELQAVVDGTSSWYALTPPQVVTWAGLGSSADPKVGPEDERLSTLNDDGSDFEEIAKLIEEKL